MARVKADINKKPIPELLQVCGNFYTAIKDNNNYPEPNPSMTDFNTAIEALAQAYKDALDRGKSLKQTMYAAEKKLRNMVAQLGAYVQWASKGDEQIILSSGFKIASTNRNPKPMPTPQDLRLSFTDTPGEIWLRWKPVKYAHMFVIQSTQSPENESSWAKHDNSTKAKILITKLLPGQSYWFRVMALGTLGKGAPSDPVQKKVL